MENNNQKAHIAWVDLLRVIACFLVILSHCCDPSVAQFDNNRTEFLSGALLGSLVRPCVPLFVMISGILLLPVQMDMGVFYNRRAKRIFIPFVFWALLLPVLYYLYLNFAVQTTNPCIVMDDHTLQATFRKLYTFIFNFNYDIIPLWYVYMLIGLYFFMPVISAWLIQASQKDIKRFLYLWGISMLLPYMQMLAPVLGYPGNYGNKGLLGVCDWNPYGTFYYFSGFLGYIVLAYYLKRFPLNWSWNRILSVSIPLFLAGYLITALGFIMTQQYYPGNYAYLEIFWYFSGINVFMMTFAVFIIMQKLKVSPSPLLSKISGLTYGIYLCHFIVVQMSYDFIHPYLKIPVYFQIPAMAIVAFSISLSIVWIMSLNKLTKKVVM